MTRRSLPPLLLLAVAALAGCAGGAPVDVRDAATAAPAQWHAPLPHDGRIEDLNRWWQQFDDPLLSDLQTAAQAVNPTLASARSRIEQSRATRVAAGASLLPTLDANANASRGRQQPDLPVTNAYSAALQAGWEIDLFGRNQAAWEAARARYAGAQAGWHEARVAVAAEVASTYLQLRSCEAQLVKVQADTTSRNETSRLTDLATKAGFQAPAAAALARATAAQGNSLYVQVKAQCDSNVKALVALTGFEEPALRSRLADRAGTLPVPSLIGVGTVPADVLNQRPDIFAAARDVEAAGAEVSQAKAARLPRVTLGGSYGRMRIETSAYELEGPSWSVGPLTVSLPLFDGGARAANVDAARARYDESTVTYRAKVRGAVREVEQALLDLDSTEARRDSARAAADGFDASYRAVEAKYRGGLGSLFELEDARRSALQAQINLVDLERDRVAAWISLYRALGGGWTPAAPAPSSDAPQPTTP